MRAIFLASAWLPALYALAQYPPPAGEPGTTAMHADSSAFVAWATGCTVQRGPMDLGNPSAGPASVGEAIAAQGAPDGSGVVSLGDGGFATLTFATPIRNGPGWDFAVFENGSNTFLELAFVEVSSNGTAFFRFPANSNTQTGVQVGPFSELDATLLNNLAGKYSAFHGTPFDLEELADQVGLDVDAITQVRVVDVVGSIQDGLATYDHAGNKVNDPWSTPFASSGFDLDAVGVIHTQLPTSIGQPSGCLVGMVLFPIPATTGITVRWTMASAGPVRIDIADAAGRPRMSMQVPAAVAAAHERRLDLSGWAADTYVLTITTREGRTHHRFIVQ